MLVGDVSLRADVLRLVEELSAREEKLDGVVCNAGALSSALTLTNEGIEQTFGCHLLFGSYLLAKLAKPLLDKAPEPRVIFVSSGGYVARHTVVQCFHHSLITFPADQNVQHKISCLGYRDSFEEGDDL